MPSTLHDGSTCQYQYQYTSPGIRRKSPSEWQFHNKILDGFLFFRQAANMNSNLGKKMMRCPRLGHEITLSYCLQESLDLPCSRIVRCWSAVFDVETFLQKELPENIWQKFINFQPKDKVPNIIELIEAAKEKK
jgi:hypothetical protein